MTYSNCHGNPFYRRKVVLKRLENGCLLFRELLALQCCYKDISPTYANVNSAKHQLRCFRRRDTPCFCLRVSSLGSLEMENSPTGLLWNWSEWVLTTGRSCRAERNGSKDSAFRFLKGKENSKAKKEKTPGIPLDKVRTRGRSFKSHLGLLTLTCISLVLELRKRPLHLQRTLLVGRLFRLAYHSPSVPQDKLCATVVSALPGISQ